MFSRRACAARRTKKIGVTKGKAESGKKGKEERGVIAMSRFCTWLAGGVVLAAAIATAVRGIAAEEPLAEKPLADGTVVKAVLNTKTTGENLLRPSAWAASDQGFTREGNAFVCDNGSARAARRGVTQSVALNQTRPEPIVASAWSKAEGVGGSPNSDYSLYIDLVFTDGTPLWGQVSPFATGSHDWERREVVILPEKPVKQVSFHMLLRGHGGKASFRDPELRVVKALAGAVIFDGVPVVCRTTPDICFQVRDVAVGSDFICISREAMGLKLEEGGRTFALPGIAMADMTLSDTTGKDRALTLVFSISESPFEPKPGREGLSWLENPRRSIPIEPGREYTLASRFRAGSSGRLSYYPLGAVADKWGNGLALGIDVAKPAFYRIGYHAGTGELYLAYDIGLSPEKPSARIRFCLFAFDSHWGMRGALARYYEIFPDSFRCRTPEQGLWMPFASISKVKGWEDFGFKFKEGNNETAWDDAHGITTFRYTEPMTWWMSMPKEMPRTMEAALAEAKRRADRGEAAAKALLTSGFHNASGQLTAQLLDTPWSNGAVWSMNSMPGIHGDVTDFKNKWNEKLRERLYGSRTGVSPVRGDLDGEYIDSSEGYVTAELDFRRDHFAAADTPLVFSQDTHQPAIFRGLVAFEYVRGIAKDVHGMGKLMMANGAPDRLCWLAPLCDVTGTETDWNPGGRWRPMSDADLLYRRAICKGKPYCFLMNTQFDKFSHELVEKYMKRSLAYGMFPGFFSANASSGHYFTRPELYERDRPLFKKYVPLCKKVAEAGWEPITLARSSDERVYVERFGGGRGGEGVMRDRRTPLYLTVFNDSPQRRTATITLVNVAPPDFSRELLAGRDVTWQDGKATITLAGEDVAVIEMGKQ
jgi:hypothetical protein